ncbi:MAG: hypothetical protein ABI591_26280 [Kofleriaceae bacterium]
MKSLVLLLVAACDFQPAPPPAPPVIERPADAAVPVVPMVPVVPDAGIGRPDATLIAVTDACLQTATHIADVLITSQTDDSLKSSYETARDRIVRATAEACTTQNWTPDAQRCFAQAKLEADLHACEKKFPTKAG